jgi:hypothetical protein
MTTVEIEARTAEARDQAFLSLRAAMPPANMADALRCSARLQAALPHPDQLERNLVMVAYGGGKDSAYTLAFVRAMQLVLDRVCGATFRLRVATNRHAGMPRAVLENIHREYEALRLGTDQDCELLLIDGNEVTPFNVNEPPRAHVMERNRLDILMTGHRTGADGRPTFCNACNLSVVNSFAVGASYGEPADLIVTGDSPKEQRQYALWVSRLARRFAPKEKAVTGDGLGRFLSNLDTIAQSYFTGIYGPDDDVVAERRIKAAFPPLLRFFSVYEDTAYAAGDHMDLLTGFLGFEFDDLAFSFTESDCGNPALMAHLRGLKCERVFHRSYAEGLAEYVSFALDLMQKKDFPADLVELMRSRYSGREATGYMRRVAGEYALTTFGLTETHLVCMAYSPFTGAGAGLEDFLRREHPALANRTGQIHDLLTGPAQDESLAGDLRRISGLEPAQLRVLYGSGGRRPGGRGTELIDAVLDGDPHKSVIRTRHSPAGPSVFEQISGR